jgi:hypothetical protein
VRGGAAEQDALDLLRCAAQRLGFAHGMLAARAPGLRRAGE